MFFTLNPFTGNLDAINESAKIYTSGIITAYPGDVYVVEHPAVTNMALIPFVFELVSSVGTSETAFTMDWQGEYDEEVSGDLTFYNGSMTLRNNAPPVSVFRADARDISTSLSQKTSGSLSSGWSYESISHIPLADYASAFGLVTSNTIDEITYTVPADYNIPWSYYLNLYMRSGSVDIFKNDSLVANASNAGLKTTYTYNGNVAVGISLVPVWDGTYFFTKFWISSTIYRSIDGKTYTTTTSTPAGSDLYASASRGKVFCFSVSTSFAVSSDHGVTWQTKNTIPVSTHGKAFVFEDTIILLSSSGASSTAYKSTDDGDTWTTITLPASITCVGVIRKGNVFCFVASNAASQYTSNFTSFTATSNLGAITKVSNTDGLCFAQGASLFFSTADAMTFTNIVANTPSPFDPPSFGNIVKLGRFYFGTQASSSAYGMLPFSADGVKWSLYKFPSNITSYAMCSKGSAISVIADNDTYLITLDNEWAKAYDPAISPLNISLKTMPVTSVFSGIGGNSTNVIVFDNSPYETNKRKSYISSDGGDAFIEGGLVSHNDNIRYVGYASGPNKWYAISDNAIVSATANLGVTWVQESTGMSAGPYIRLRNVPDQSGFYCVRSDARCFLSNTAMSYTGAMVDSIDCKQQNGQSLLFTQGAMATLYSYIGNNLLKKPHTSRTGSYTCIAYGGGILVRPVSGTNIIEWSEDNGATWNDATTPSSLARHDAYFVNGVFVVLSKTSDIVTYSFDGRKWYEQSANTGSGTGFFRTFHFDNVIWAVINASSNKIVRIDVARTPAHISLVAGDTITMKNVAGISDISCFEIDNTATTPTSTPSGQSGEYKLLIPDYVNPRYIVTDSWDVYAHKMISITSATMQGTIPSGTSVYGLVSFDDGATWKTYTGGVFADVSIASGIRTAVNTSGVLLSIILGALAGLAADNQKIKFIIDLRTTASTATPIISGIVFNYEREGLYTQVPTGRGLEWEVYNASPTQTVFKKIVDNGGRETILNVFPITG